MTEEEVQLWQTYEAARKKLIVFYLPVVDSIARHLAWSTGRDWEDLRQDGTIGLMKAVVKFEPGRDVPFTGFARQYIRGAILDSRELTRNMTRTQEEIYRKVRRAEDALTTTLGRNPSVEEIAKKTKLTREQIENSFAARGINYAREFLDDDDLPSSRPFELSRSEMLILIEEAVAELTETEQAIIRLHYLEGMPHEKIAEELEIIPVELTKIRQRAIARVTKICQRSMGKLQNQFGVKGGYDENRRSGKSVAKPHERSLDRWRIGVLSQ